MVQYNSYKPQAQVPVYILVGIPGSGKSSYAAELAELVGAEVHNADSIREELYGDAAIQGDGKKVFGLLYTRAKDDVAIGCPIILDNTNITKKVRQKAMKTFDKYNCKFVAVVMNTPIEECKCRNKMRDRTVPDWVIDRMINNYEEPTVDEGFDKICQVWYGG